LGCSNNRSQQQPRGSEHEHINLPVAIATNKALALCFAKMADNTTNDLAALTAAEEIAEACFDIVPSKLKQVRKYTATTWYTRP
jgi:hypothetical protein